MNVSSNGRPLPDDPADRSLLMTLLYFDVFRHPLTADELARYCPAPRMTGAEAAERCRRAVLGALMREEEGLFLLRDAPPEAVRARREREAGAQRLWPVARVMARVISRFPFVRGVFVSGELAKDVAGPGSDIDFFVLTAERRLWVVRTMLILFKKIFLLNRKRFFCINHIQSIGQLTAASRSYYDAIEVVTLRPLVGAAHYREYLAANAWVSEWLPNAVASAARSAGLETTPFVRQVIESCFPRVLTDRLDEWLRRQWDRLWARRYPKLSVDERAKRFAATPVLSTAYGTDIAERISTAWSERLAAYGISAAPKEAA